MERDAPTDVDVIDSTEDMIERHPLVQLFGSSVRAKVLVVLLDAEQPLNPSTIQERADINHQSWYDALQGREDDDLGLEDTGMVKQVGNAGNSPLYAVPDAKADLRTEWLQNTRDWTSAVMYHGRDPPTSDNE
jgi:hypothetical protein